MLVKKLVSFSAKVHEVVAALFVMYSKKETSKFYFEGRQILCCKDDKLYTAWVNNRLITVHEAGDRVPAGTFNFRVQEVDE